MRLLKFLVPMVLMCCQAQASSQESKPAALPALTPELRGDVYMARKMFRDAVDYYQQAPPTSAIMNKIGIAFHSMSELDVAKKYYLQALRLNAANGEAANNLGAVYYSRHSYRRSIALYKRALKYSNSPASVWVNLGTAYFARQNFNQASTCYETALKLDPDVLEHTAAFGTHIQERSVENMALYHLYLAKAYAKEGEKDRALLYLRKSLEEGLKDRKKLPDMPEFSSLREDTGFKELLAENPKAL